MRALLQIRCQVMSSQTMLRRICGTSSWVKPMPASQAMCSAYWQVNIPQSIPPTCWGAVLTIFVLKTHALSLPWSFTDELYMYALMLPSTSLALLFGKEAVQVEQLAGLDARVDQHPVFLYPNREEYVVDQEHLA